MPALAPIHFELIQKLETGRRRIFLQSIDECAVGGVFRILRYLWNFGGKTQYQTKIRTVLRLCQLDAMIRSVVEEPDEQSR